MEGIFNVQCTSVQIKNAYNVPVIVAGDFNTPSDLDYTEDTKSVIRVIIE